MFRERNKPHMPYTAPTRHPQADASMLFERILFTRLEHLELRTT